MAFLLDTNILVRLAVPNDPEHPPVVRALSRLNARREPLVICSQNLIELWNVSTRPSERNGLGRTPEGARRLLEFFSAAFIRLEDTDEVFEAWAQLVSKYQVSGTLVHDARLVAVMKVNSIPGILTLNSRDFQRFSAEAITVVSPVDLQ